MSAKDETQHALAHYSAMAEEATAQVAALAKSVEAAVDLADLGCDGNVSPEALAVIAAWAFAHGAEVKA
jgi:hypothetical protein